MATCLYQKLQITVPFLSPFSKVAFTRQCHVHMKSFKRFQLPYLRNYCSSGSSDRIPVAQPLRTKKGIGTVNEVSAFVDRKTVEVVGGKGGDGMVSFASVFLNEHAGPDGGDGGNGGHVMFQAATDTKSLSHLPSLIKGKAGENGHSCNCHGRNADHLVISVPFGTMFKDPDTGEVIADLATPEESVFLAARGGAGGKGNKFFATAENQGPEIAEYGGDGESVKYVIEMATIAQFGLLGYPNAGKSTLLRAISRARPKVASYPFTTIRPHVGMILYDDLEQIAVADIPGIIADAHLNRGLGIQFLRHIQRCLCLLYVIDMSTTKPTPIDVYEMLKDELRHYDATMLDRPSLIVANKLDLEEAKENFNEFRDYVGEEMPILPVSAKYGVNLKDLLLKLRVVYDQRSSQGRKTDQNIQKYEPVRVQDQRKHWRRNKK